MPVEPYLQAAFNTAASRFNEDPVAGVRMFLGIPMHHNSNGYYKEARNFLREQFAASPDLFTRTIAGFNTATPRDQWNLANLYAICSKGEEAAAWLNKSADQGYAPAQHDLGWCYENGTGVPKDPVQTARWRRKAAEQGYAPAQNNLGICYANGTGVPKDPEQAASWYRKAAEQGDAPAQNNLGWRYENGTGVPKDPEQAASWYRKAAEQGDALAQRNLGCCYENGTGVSKDPEQAVSWFRKAAEQGNAAAQNDLGICYANGTGVPKDPVQAASWYRKAAEQGDAPAQRNLGICYANGTGVPKDILQAAILYRLYKQSGGKEVTSDSETLIKQWLNERSRESPAKRMETIKTAITNIKDLLEIRLKDDKTLLDYAGIWGDAPLQEHLRERGAKTGKSIIDAMYPKNPLPEKMPGNLPRHRVNTLLPAPVRAGVVPAVLAH